MNREREPISQKLATGTRPSIQECRNTVTYEQADGPKLPYSVLGTLMKTQLCVICGFETRPLKGCTVVKNLGPGVYLGSFGYEGTGAQEFMWDFDQKIGDRMRAKILN